MTLSWIAYQHLPKFYYKCFEKMEGDLCEKLVFLTSNVEKKRRTLERLFFTIIVPIDFIKTLNDNDKTIIQTMYFREYESLGKGFQERLDINLKNLECYSNNN